MVKLLHFYDCDYIVSYLPVANSFMGGKESYFNISCCFVFFLFFFINGVKFSRECGSCNYSTRNAQLYQSLCYLPDFLG